MNEIGRERERARPLKQRRKRNSFQNSVRLARLDLLEGGGGEFVPRLVTTNVTEIAKPMQPAFLLGVPTSKTYTISPVGIFTCRFCVHLPMR